MLKVLKVEIVVMKGTIVGTVVETEVLKKVGKEGIGTTTGVEVMIGTTETVEKTAGTETGIGTIETGVETGTEGVVVGTEAMNVAETEAETDITVKTEIILETEVLVMKGTEIATRGIEVIVVIERNVGNPDMKTPVEITTNVRNVENMTMIGVIVLIVASQSQGPSPKRGQGHTPDPLIDLQTMVGPDPHPTERRPLQRGHPREAERKGGNIQTNMTGM